MWKGTVFAEFRANRSKTYRNCAFPQNLHTRKLGESSVFYAVIDKFVVADDRVYPLHDDEYLLIVAQTCADLLTKIRTSLPEPF